MIQDIIKNKLIIGFTAFGGGLALILGLIFRIGVAAVLIRTLLGALLMGALALGLDFFLKKSLSAEDYQSLMGSPSAAEGTSSAPKVDLVDENPDENAYAELYQTPSAPARAEEAESEVLGVSSPKNDAFEEQSFADAPRVSPIPTDETELKPIPAMNDDLQNLQQVKKEEKIKQSSSVASQVKFNAGSKKVTADAEVVAKAIHTLLQKEG